jgi:hypothetical protein
LNKEWEKHLGFGNKEKYEASDLFERIAAAEPSKCYQLLRSFGKHNCFWNKDEEES